MALCLCIRWWKLSERSILVGNYVTYFCSPWSIEIIYFSGSFLKSPSIVCRKSFLIRKDKNQLLFFYFSPWCMEWKNATGEFLSESWYWNINHSGSSHIIFSNLVLFIWKTFPNTWQRKTPLQRIPTKTVSMRSSLVVRASDCTSCNGPGFDPSIRRHSGIWGAADGAVLNKVWKKISKNI